MDNGTMIRRSPGPLVERSSIFAFGNRVIASSRLRRSQFDLYSMVLIGIPASRFPHFPPEFPYSIPGSDPVHEVCGVDELWIFLYTLSRPKLCLWTICYFMNHASSSAVHKLFGLQTPFAVKYFSRSPWPLLKIFKHKSIGLLCEETYS